ncbi:hypothetical protein V6N13_079262 [Hibiscus sabdariffa]|uniref:Uncharacterized protein n=1 Tax=Hibiscus sabdariffa TaxID=183260 RepID=A0ABR2RRI4_9ROSI
MTRRGKREKKFHVASSRNYKGISTAAAKLRNHCRKYRFTTSFGLYPFLFKCLGFAFYDIEKIEEVGVFIDDEFFLLFRSQSSSCENNVLETSSGRPYNGHIQSWAHCRFSLLHTLCSSYDSVVLIHVYLLTCGIYYAVPAGCRDGHPHPPSKHNNHHPNYVGSLAMSPDPNYAAFLKKCCPPPSLGALGDLTTTMPVDMAAPNCLDNKYYNQRLFFQKCLTTLACHFSFRLLVLQPLKKTF